LFVQVLDHESDGVSRFLNQQVLDDRYEQGIYIFAIEILLQLGLDISSLSDMNDVNGGQNMSIAGYTYHDLHDCQTCLFNRKMLSDRRNRVKQLFDRT